MNRFLKKISSELEKLTKYGRMNNVVSRKKSNSSISRLDTITIDAEHLCQLF